MSDTEQLDLPLAPTINPFDDSDWRAKDLRRDLNLWTEEDLAAALGHRSTTTLATWRAEKYGPKATKLGKSVFYRLDDINAWIAERSVA